MNLYFSKITSSYPFTTPKLLSYSIKKVENLNKNAVLCAVILLFVCVFLISNYSQNKANFAKINHQKLLCSNLKADLKVESNLLENVIDEIKRSHALKGVMILAQFKPAILKFANKKFMFDQLVDILIKQTKYDVGKEMQRYIEYSWLLNNRTAAFIDDLTIYQRIHKDVLEKTKANITINNILNRLKEVTLILPLPKHSKIVS